MIDPEEQALAQAYVTMAQNPAFLNMLEWIQEEVDAAEKVAIAAPATMKTSDLRNLMVAWQQRKLVLNQIKTKILDASEYLKELSQEIEDGRAIEHDRSTRANW